jgi:uncharacterized membrane protein
MPSVQKEITIDAPIDVVFRALDDPEAMPQYVPSVREVGDVQRTDRRIGDSFTAIYSMFGVKLTEKFTYIEYAPPWRIKARFEGAMTGTMGCALDPWNGATRVRLEIDYELRGGALGKAVSAALVERMNAQTAEHMLENIKLLVEAAQAAASTSVGEVS